MPPGNGRPQRPSDDEPPQIIGRRAHGRANPELARALHDRVRDGSHKAHDREEQRKRSADHEEPREGLGQPRGPFQILRHRLYANNDCGIDRGRQCPGLPDERLRIAVGPRDDRDPRGVPRLVEGQVEMSVWTPAQSAMSDVGCNAHHLRSPAFATEKNPAAQHVARC